MASGDSSGDPSVIRNLRTNLRRVDNLRVWQSVDNAQVISGIVLPRVTYPKYRSGDTTVWPADDYWAQTASSAKHLASGNFTIEFASTAGPILWKAVGRI